MRDFGQVFDAYAQFEESMINAKMETTAEMGPSEEGEDVHYVCIYVRSMYLSECASVLM